MNGNKRDNAHSNVKQGAKKRKPNPQKPPRAHPIRDANKSNPILMGKQGFSISYNHTIYDKTKSFGAEAIDLLNQYADKIYRSEGRSCYFAQRLTDIPPVFIETDIPDPCVIVDAIYEDIIAPPEQRLVKDVEKTACWSKFLPVHMTCLFNPEMMVNAAKDILKPAMVEQAVPTPLKYRIYMKCKEMGKVVVKTMEERLHNYVSTSSVAHVQDKSGYQKSIRHDAVLRLMVTGNTCCISWMPKVQKFKGYNVMGFYKQRRLKEAKEEELQEAGKLMVENGVEKEGLTLKDTLQGADTPKETNTTTKEEDVQKGDESAK